ncbi:MAG: multidrug effflux MFS transporter [Proteobacteria bacterium]|nr:multidrug effflux MFS transporter [Pseudomonadota bacterium]MDA1058104.1 multidrug effflux MFS transporter [Pseudomonadota bacterium]
MLSKSGTFTFILFAGGLFAFSPLSTDMYIPALPSLAQSLNTTVPAVQLTLSVYLVGFALSQLFYGPIADRFGRKPTILGGIAIYTAGSVVCMMAGSIEMLVVGRFVQAMGAAFGQILGRTVIRDLAKPEESARILAYATVIMGGTSLITPSMGGLITVYFGWQIIFAVLIGYAMIYFLIVSIGFRESVVALNRDAIRPTQMLANFGVLLRHRLFLRNTVSISFMFGTLFTFLSGSSFLFIGVYGVPTTRFGLIFTAMAAAFTIASAVVGRVGGRMPHDVIYGMAATGAMLSAFAALAMVVAGWINIVALVGAMAVLSFAMGIMVPLAFAGSMAPYPAIAGTASTLIGFIQSVFSAAMGALVGLLFDGTGVPMFALIAALTTGALLSFILIRPTPALRTA